MKGGKGRSRGGKVSSAFNALADAYASNAFSSQHDLSDAYDGDGKVARSQPSAVVSSGRGGVWG